jgi:hypothetical protein
MQTQIIKALTKFSTMDIVIDKKQDGYLDINEGGSGAIRNNITKKQLNAI